MGILARAVTATAAGVYAASARNCLTTLIYHRVVGQPDELFPEIPSAARFRWQMELLQRHFRVLPLPEAAGLLVARKLPARAACITFDDGYADNAAVALPILRDFGLTATFFVASSFLSDGCMWNDLVIEAVRDCRQGELDLEPFGLGRHPLDTPVARRAAVDAVIAKIKYLEPVARLQRANEIAARCGMGQAPRLMMTPDQVRELATGGMQIGAHTLTHPILRNIPLPEARDEIARNRDELQSITRAPVTTFAYPNGQPQTDYGTEHVQLVRELGFAAAVSTSWGVAAPGCDLWQLPRFTPWDVTPPRFALRLLQNRLVNQPRFA